MALLPLQDSTIEMCYTNAQGVRASVTADFSAVRLIGRCCRLFSHCYDVLQEAREGGYRGSAIGSSRPPQKPASQVMVLLDRL